MSSRVLKVLFSILGLALIAAWAFSEITLHRWETRWSDFRVHWESKGENFGLPSAPSIPDADNLVEHPFIKKLRAGDPVAMERLYQMDPVWIEPYQDWLGSLPVSEDRQEPPMPESIARAVLTVYEGFSSEIILMGEAAHRSACVPPSPTIAAKNAWHRNLSSYKKGYLHVDWRHKWWVTKR